MDGDSPTMQKIFWYGKRLGGHIRNTFLSLSLYPLDMQFTKRLMLTVTMRDFTIFF
jgi:hypothetical protein